MAGAKQERNQEAIEKLQETVEKLTAASVTKEEFAVLKADIVLKYAIRTEVHDIIEILGMKSNREDMLDL